MPTSISGMLLGWCHPGLGAKPAAPSPAVPLFLTCHSHLHLLLVPGTPWTALPALETALATTGSHLNTPGEGIRAVVVHRMLLNTYNTHPIAFAKQAACCQHLVLV